MMSSISIIRKFISLPNTSRIIELKIGRFNRSRIEIIEGKQKYYILSLGAVNFNHNIMSYTYDVLRLKSRTGILSIKITDVDEFINSDITSLVLRYGRDILDENVVSNIKEGLNVSDFDEFLNQ